jgi:hypothetical protein
MQLPPGEDGTAVFSQEVVPSISRMMYGLGHMDILAVSAFQLAAWRVPALL